MPDEVFILAILSLVSITALGFGLMRSINRHLDRKHQSERGLDEDRVLSELDEVRGRLEGVDELRGRMVDLEERVDFAERLLAEGGRSDRKTLGASRELGGPD